MSAFAFSALVVAASAIGSMVGLVLLGGIVFVVSSFRGKGHRMSTSLDKLTAQVTASTTVEGSAKVLIDGFAAQLTAAGTDQAKLDALAANLKASSDALAAAVAANTPAAPPPAPPTTPGGTAPAPAAG